MTEEEKWRCVLNVVFVSRFENERSSLVTNLFKGCRHKRCDYSMEDITKHLVKLPKKMIRNFRGANYI